jgi:hypothetical protein
MNCISDYEREVENSKDKHAESNINLSWKFLYANNDFCTKTHRKSRQFKDDKITVKHTLW